MRKLFVDLKEKSYNIYFNDSFLGLAEMLGDIDAPKKLLIVTDSNVDKLYKKEVSDILENSGFDVSSFAFTAGEENKNMDTILDICRACQENALDRKSMIIALGGGVVGDMAGFASAIYLRGIRFVQVPTTLLSQSDSSVGGKTGIDFMNGKNLLGAFHQPKAVYINVSVLKTLPKREFISGMGEVIKHGIIRNKDFFYYLKENKEKIKELNSELLIDMAYTNCSIKADVVMKDEFESGLRQDLNFGHTIGHAVESYFNFSKTHGECVGIGMALAGFISKKRGELSENEFNDIISILKEYGFTLNVKIDDIEEVLNLMDKDKKKSEGKLSFVLPTEIGKVIRKKDVETCEICDALKVLEQL